MVTTAVPVGANVARPMTKDEKKVIFASSLGTVFEWYDFYLYGALAAIIAKQFFANLDPTAAPPLPDAGPTGSLTAASAAPCAITQ